MTVAPLAAAQTPAPAQTFTITVTMMSPTDISLTPSHHRRNNAANADRRLPGATDANAGQTHSFSLVSGTGSTDNASFTIDGTALKLTPSANFETEEQLPRAGAGR